MSFDDFDDLEDYFDELDGYVNYMRHEYCFDEFEGYGDDYAGAKGILSSFLPDGTSVTHGDNKNRRSDPASEGNKQLYVVDKQSVAHWKFLQPASK